MNCVRQIIRLGERENSHFESDPLRSVEVKAPQVEQAATGLAAVQWKHVQVIAFDAIPTAAALRAVPPVFNPGCKGMLAGNVSHAPKHDSAEVLRVLSGSCAPDTLRKASGPRDAGLSVVLNARKVNEHPFLRVKRSARCSSHHNDDGPLPGTGAPNTGAPGNGRLTDPL